MEIYQKQSFKGSFKVYFDKGAENKSIKMFLYSIIYLYFLFLSMIIDHLGLFN